MVCPTVLVIEDEPIVAMDIARIAIESGYELCGTAASGPEAMAIAETRPPDLALVDVRLIGRMSGLEVAQRLYAAFGTLTVFITADAPTLEREGIPFPCLDVVNKPFSHDRLEEVLAAARKRLRNSEPAGALR